MKEFLGKAMSSDEFQEKFMEARKEMHLRKLKSDKMTELLRQPMPPNRPPVYPPQQNFYPMPPTAGAPYPMGGGMPYPPGGMPVMPMPNHYRPY